MRSATTQVISGRVNGDGTVNGPDSGRFSVQRTQVGDYFIIFNDPAFRYRAITFQGISNTLFFSVQPGYGRTVEIRVYNYQAATFVDSAFNFIATGG